MTVSVAMTQSYNKTYANATSVASAIPATGNTDLLEICTRGLAQLFVQFDVTTQALDGFIVSGKAQDGSYKSMYTAITSTPGGLIVAASGTLASTAAAAGGWFVMNVKGLDYVKVSVSGATDDTAAVTMQAQASA